MKTDAYFDNAVMNAVEELKSRGLIDFQISSTGTEMFTTVHNETFSAGAKFRLLVLPFLYLVAGEGKWINKYSFYETSK